jgi:hypothetical protein
LAGYGVIPSWLAFRQGSSAFTPSRISNSLRSDCRSRSHLHMQNHDIDEWHAGRRRGKWRPSGAPIIAAFYTISTETQLVRRTAPSFLRARFCLHNAGPDEERYILTSPIVRVRIRKNFI